MAREPGARSKIAVTSRDADVDPVGACVGMKGSRVQAVVQELRGEKIDIVPFDRDPARYVIAAIQPAEVHKVIVDEADGRMELVVPDEKLSLAIGRKGQNVRLAAQLTGLEARHHQRVEVQADGGGGDRSRCSRSRGSPRPSPRRCTGWASARSRRSPRQEPRSSSGIQGVGSVELATKIKERAETTMERLRQERICARPRASPSRSTRARAAAVRARRRRAHDSASRGSRLPQSVEDVLREDEDKLAIRTGFGIKKARAIKQGAESFLATESKVLEKARAAAKRRAAGGPAQPAPSDAGAGSPAQASDSDDSDDSDDSAEADADDTSENKTETAGSGDTGAVMEEPAP